MQELLPVVKAALLEWAQLALGNPLFAVSLIAVTALLAGIIGMIRSIPVKRRAAANEQARAELAIQLSATQQQAAGLQERLMQRNQQISGTVQALSAGFDVGEQPLTVASEDLASEALWQQHGRVVEQLASRLRSEQQANTELQQSYQAEREKHLEKEAVIDNLQNTLAEKTLQIGGLERQAAEILEKHTAQSARLAELEQQRLQWDDAKIQLEEKLVAKEAELNRLQLQTEARKEDELFSPAIHPEPAQTVEPIELAILQAAVGEEPISRAPVPEAVGEAVMPSPPAAAGEAMGAQSQQQTIELADWDYQPEAPALPKAETQAAASGKEGGGGFVGKLKGLFGKSLPEPSATVGKSGETGSAEAVMMLETHPDPQPQSAAGFAQSRLSKATTLFGRSKQRSAAEEVQASESPQVAIPSGSGAETERAAVSMPGQLDKIKHLFGMGKG